MMKLLNKVSCPTISIVLLLIPISQLFAMEPNQVYLAQAQAWQCRADWRAGGSTYSKASATENEARQDLDREILRDRVNNNGQNTISNKTCFTFPLPGGSSPSSNPGSNSNPCASSGFNSCTRASVDRIYREVLGRGSDPGGLDSWGFAVDSRKLSLSEVRYRIAFDAESTKNVTAIYREVLGRDPDAGGLDSWRGGLANGLSLQGVRSRIASDTESRNNINNLYRQYLCRDADPDGMNHHINLLASGQMALDQIRNGIANGAEAQQHKNGCH